jgi:hypothetical protein
VETETDEEILDWVAEEREAQRLADQLASCLSSTGGWYTDSPTTTDTFVIFASKVFRYRNSWKEATP